MKHTEALFARCSIARLLQKSEEGVPLLPSSQRQDGVVPTGWVLVWEDAKGEEGSLEVFYPGGSKRV